VEKLVHGDQAPPFKLHQASGPDVALTDLQGQRAVIYFYPKAATPGCTTEACDFRDNLARFQALGFSVVGVSPDPVEALQTFAETEQLTYPLLSDPDATVARAWGAYGEKTVNGQVTTGVLRSTVLVDATGSVISAEYGVDAQGHVARLLESVNAAQ
jgi:peroxiredoxin Q/BCP